MYLGKIKEKTSWSAKHKLLVYALLAALCFPYACRRVDVAFSTWECHWKHDSNGNSSHAHVPSKCSLNFVPHAVRGEV